MRKMFVPLFFAAFCAALGAQTGRPPTRVGIASDFVALAPSAVTGSALANVTPPVIEVRSLELHPNLDLAGLRRPGEFYLIAGVTRGMPASASVLTGVLNTTVNPWAFTETTATDFGSQAATVGWTAATMTPDLEVVMAETAGQVKWSVRTARNVAFPAAVDTPLTSPAFSKLHRLESGREYHSSQGPSSPIVGTQEIDRNLFPRSDPWSSPLISTLLPSVNLPLNSAEVLEDGRGDARATIHSAQMGNGDKYRPWFNSVTHLPNTELSKQFHIGPADGTNFVHPGHLAGTTVYCVQPPGAPYTIPKAIGIVASSGDEVDAAGGTVNLSAWLPYFGAPPPQPWIVTLLIGFPSPDMAIGGWRGQLAIALPFVPLPARIWQQQTLTADWVFPTPAVTPGSLLWAQTLAYDPAGAFDGDGNGPDYFYLGNTAPIYFR